MRTWSATVMASALLLGLLAGCVSGDGSFSIETPDSPDGAYTFRAGTEADNYTWSMGDGLTTLYGREVSHTYDFRNGKVDVRLTTRTGTESSTMVQPLTLGTGVNSKATFFLEASHVWTVPGEKVKFSAAASTDPDGDPLRFSWSCLRDSDAVRQPTHVHAPAPGLDYAKASAGTVTSGLATKPIPAATMPITGDMCEGLGSGTRTSTKATIIEGAFAKTGIYKVFLLAADPVHPTTFGEFKIFVTAPEERPEPKLAFEFTGTLQAGRQGQLQSFCDTAELGACDTEERSFALPLGALGGNLTVAYDLGAGAGSAAANNVTIALYKGTKQVAATNGAQGMFALDPAKLESGSYRLVAQLAQGANVPWTARVDVTLDMDPSKVY